MTLPEAIASIGWDEAHRRWQMRGRTDHSSLVSAANPVDGHDSALSWVKMFCIALSAVCHRQQFSVEEVEASPDMIRALAADTVVTNFPDRARRYSTIWKKNGVDKLPRGGWLRVGVQAEDLAKHGRNWEGWGFKKKP